MTEIEPISTGAAVQTPKPVTSVPEEPSSPWGRQITTVQPHPTPLIAATPEAEAHPDQLAKMQHVAQAKSDITGTGLLVDLIV
jgi:hypothetical protein